MQLVTWLPVAGAGGTFSGRCDATQWSRGVESWGRSGVFNYKLWHGGATAQTQSLAGKMENAWVPFAGLVISFELDKREWTGAKITLTLAALI